MTTIIAALIIAAAIYLGLKRIADALQALTLGNMKCQLKIGEPRKTGKLNYTMNEQIYIIEVNFDGKN